MSKLQGVHPDLQRVMYEAITNSPYDFRITEGVRSRARQEELFAAGKSQTMNSRHLTGHAVDIAIVFDGQISWDMSLYREVSKHILAVAVLNDVPLIWGGNWKTLKDGPHFELDRKVYP